MTDALDYESIAYDRAEHTAYMRGELDADLPDRVHAATLDRQQADAEWAQWMGGVA